jgi:hypothetical protein
MVFFSIIINLTFCITPHDILDITNSVLQNEVPFTADRFGSLDWLNSHPNIMATMTLKDDKNEGLFKLCADGLADTEYCVFSNGNIILTVFQDKGFHYIL